MLQDLPAVAPCEDEDCGGPGGLVEQGERVGEVGVVLDGVSASCSAEVMAASSASVFVATGMSPTLQYLVLALG
eukprot:3066905-Rhodomonas_salina.2